MLTKKEKKGKVQVTFAMPAIEGCESLYLVGEFNEWNETDHPMQRADNGSWLLALDLEAGREYQYRYRTDDGVWHTDPAADAYVPNAFGSDNSVVST
jgi:1,4-alpha-glucan branching enzyme